MNYTQELTPFKFVYPILALICYFIFHLGLFFVDLSADAVAFVFAAI